MKNLIPADVARQIKAQVDKQVSAHGLHDGDMSFNFGITFSKTEPPKQVEPTDLNQLFGKVEAAKITFIPQMLHALVMEYALKFFDHCKEHRIRQLHKHTRMLKRCVNEFSTELYLCYGHQYFKAYKEYVRRYAEATATDVYLFVLNLQQESANQLPDKQDREIAAMLTFIVLLVTFSQDYDKKMDELIANRINAPVQQKPEAYMVLIHALCVDMAETFGYKLQVTENMRLWIRILVNKAKKLCEDIFSQEAIDCH